MVALTTRLPAVASPTGKIISRDTPATHGSISPKYTISVGTDQISHISLDDILDYVSEHELERFENNEFKEAAAEQDRLAREQAAKKRRGRPKKVIDASSSGESLTGSSSSEEDQFVKPGLPIAEGRHGRPRPTYSHLFPPKRQRGPNKTSGDEQSKGRGRPPKVMKDLPQAAAELSLSEDRPKRRKLSHTSSSASRSGDERPPVPLGTSFRDLKARGQLSKSTTEVVIHVPRRAPSVAATASTSDDDDVVQVTPTVSVSLSPKRKATTPPMLFEQRAQTTAAIPQRASIQMATMPQSHPIRSPTLDMGDKSVPSKPEVSATKVQAQQLPRPASNPVKVKVIQPVPRPRPLQPQAQISTQSGIKVNQPQLQPRPQNQTQSTIPTQLRAQVEAQARAQAQTSSQSRPQALPQSRTQSQVQLQPKKPQPRPQSQAKAFTLTQGNNKQIITIDSDSDDTDELQSRPPPPPAPAAAPAPENLSSSGADSSESETWEIEAILSNVLSDPKTHDPAFGTTPVMLYEVKWVGWDKTTWEPASSFDDEDVVNVYHGLTEARKLSKARAT